MLRRDNRGVGNTEAFTFQVVKPHMLAEIYTGQLEPNEVLVGDAYADGNYAIPSGTLAYGQSYGLSGAISSDSIITNVSGHIYNSFSPDTICTRAHVVTFLWRSMTA